LLLVRTATVEEVMARIDDAARAEPGGAVAFDGDGTLWSGDIGEDFFASLLDGGGLTTEAHDAFVREATEGGVDATGDAAEVVRRIHAAYLGGTFSEERICEIITWACAGWTRARLDEFSAGIVESEGLAGRLQEEAVRILRHCARSGIDVHLVSASPRSIVHAAARIVGIDPARAIGVTEKCDADDLVLTEVIRPIPYDHGKVTCLRATLGARPLYAAFGDNAFDVPLLQAAKIPVMIRPKQRLRARAQEIPGVVELERL
jgi:phosphoserine phosphatase